MYYCTLYRSKIKKPTSQKPNLKEGWLHSNTLKETFPLQIECAKKEKAEEKLGKKTKGGGGLEKRQRSIMKVQTETGSTASLSCYYTAGFHYGVTVGGQSSSPSDPLHPTPRSHLCKEGTLPGCAPCGGNDKDVCGCA